jgi:putative protease
MRRGSYGPRRFLEETEMLQVPELLSPAGDLERLRYAVCYGADAVYCGMTEFGMRSAPANFTPDQLKEGVLFAHARGRRVYLTLNTLPTNEEADRMPEAIRTAADAGVDAFIVADLGVVELCRRVAPEVEVHFSTQTGITNYAAATAAYHLGAKRVVLARELSLEDIAVIRDKTPPELEIEAFVHGAMCVSFSGRCLLSTYMTGRDSNRGECAQPCRWKYHICEEKRPGQFYEIGESPEGSYILNADDLCTAPFLDLICKAGVDSLKIEGRAKTFYYVASVTAAYRRALDTFLANPTSDNFELPDDVYEELKRTSHRRYSPGFYFGRDKARQRPDIIGYQRDWDFMGTVDNWENGIAFCQQRGKWCLGDTLEALTPDGSRIPLKPAWIKNEKGEAIEATPVAMQKYTIPCEKELPPMTLLRKQNPMQPAAYHPLGENSAE